MGQLSAGALIEHRFAIAKAEVVKVKTERMVFSQPLRCVDAPDCFLIGSAIVEVTWLIVDRTKVHHRHFPLRSRYGSIEAIESLGNIWTVTGVDEAACPERDQFAARRHLEGCAFADVQIDLTECLEHVGPRRVGRTLRADGTGDR